MLAQQDTETEVLSEEVPQTIPVSSLESLIPYPPTAEEEVAEEPVFEEDSLAALEGFGGSHAVPVGPTHVEEEAEEEAPVDINNIDIAALGESLGLDPSNSRRFRKDRECYPDYDEYYPEPDCYSPKRRYYPEEKDCYYPREKDCYSPKRRGYYPQEKDCYSPRRGYKKDDCYEPRGGRDYYCKPEKNYYPERKRSPSCDRCDRRYKPAGKKAAVCGCLPTDETIRNLKLQDVLCDDKTECERYCQTPDYGELNFGHAGARSNQG